MCLLQAVESSLYQVRIQSSGSPETELLFLIHVELEAISLETATNLLEELPSHVAAPTCPPHASPGPGEIPRNVL